MPPKGVKAREHREPQLGPLNLDYEAMCLYRARENERCIPLVRLLSETVGPEGECEKTTQKTVQNIPKIFQETRKPRSKAPPRHDGGGGPGDGVGVKYITPEYRNYLE